MPFQPEWRQGGGESHDQLLLRKFSLNNTAGVRMFFISRLESGSKTFYPQFANGEHE